MLKKRMLVGLCSWNNPPLLKSCLSSLFLSMDLSKDGIAVVLNEADNESISFLLEHKVPFIAMPHNIGVLAIDCLIPFIQNSDYFLNTNDDMLFHPGFADDLISLIDKNYPASASCWLIENFFSDNPCVVVDDSLIDVYSSDTYAKFLSNHLKYQPPHCIISYNHPICVKSKDFLAVGGYSGNWDWDFVSGYGRDDMFAFMLFSLHQGNFKFICSNKSFVFHASSATMKRLPDSIRRQHNLDTFQRKTGMNIYQFREVTKWSNQIHVS
jgi:GT2 family glycosyltransferase